MLNIPPGQPPGHRRADGARLCAQPSPGLGLRPDWRASRPYSCSRCARRSGPATVFNAPALFDTAKGFPWTDLPREALPALGDPLFDKASHAAVKAQLRITPPSYSVPDQGRDPLAHPGRYLARRAASAWLPAATTIPTPSPRVPTVAADGRRSIRYPSAHTSESASAARLLVSAVSEGRIEAFSDGVIAIIITIMVLELHAPEVHCSTTWPLLPTFVAYVLSFLLLGTWWNNYHHLLHAAKVIDARVLWANLGLLFFLSLVPFGTAWVGGSTFAPVPVALYGVILFMAGAAYYALVRALVAAPRPPTSLAEAIGLRRQGKGLVAALRDRDHAGAGGAAPVGSDRRGRGGDVDRPFSDILERFITKLRIKRCSTKPRIWILVRHGDTEWSRQADATPSRDRSCRSRMSASGRRPRRSVRALAMRSLHPRP